MTDVADEVQSGEECDERRARVIEVEVILGQRNLARFTVPSSIDETKVRNASGAPGQWVELRPKPRFFLVVLVVDGGLSLGLPLACRLPFSPVKDVEVHRDLCYDAVRPGRPFKVRALLHNEAMTGAPLVEGVNSHRFGNDEGGWIFVAEPRCKLGQVDAWAFDEHVLQAGCTSLWAKSLI